MSASDFIKLRDIEEEAQENVIEIVKVNDVALTPDANKAVNVEVPTNTSDLTNDGEDGTSPYATEDYVDENGGKIDKIEVNGVEQTITNKTVDIAVPEAATAAPLMDGTAAIGSSNKYAKEDHVHPSDTTKADKATTLAGYGITDAYTKTEVDNLISAVFTFKGTKATVAELPSSGNKVGDVWHVTEDDNEYVWTDSNAWEGLGVTISLEGYATEAWVQTYAATAAQGALADTALQTASIAGLTISKNSNTITAAQLKTALDVNKVEASQTNGNIKIDSVETTVYTLPSTTLDSTDFLILNCGDSTTEAPSGN